MSYDEARDGEIAAVLALELEALAAARDGDGPRAARLASEAAAAEDAMTFEFGPPPVVKPAHELAGEILLAQGRPADARERQFTGPPPPNPPELLMSYERGAPDRSRPPCRGGPCFLGAPISPKQDTGRPGSPLCPDRAPSRRGEPRTDQVI